MKKRQGISGFSLVELLVVMAIFSVIFAGVIKVYEVSNRSYMVQGDMAEMQQNIRVAKMFLERDVRMAGAGVGTKFGVTGDRVYAIEFENAEGASGTDKIMINYIDFEVTTCDGVLPQLTLQGGMPPTASVANVFDDLSVAPYSKWTAFTCDGTNYGGNPYDEFQAIITSPDGTMSDVLWVTKAQVTGGPNFDNIQNSPFPTGCGSSCNKVINTYPEGSSINLFNTDSLVRLEYNVVNNVLMRNGQTLVEDIEDLQFAFGLDTTGDGDVDFWRSDADLTDTEKDQVRLVRISILGRTSREHRGFSGSRPALEDHGAAIANDGYRRKPLTVTVKVRNLGLS